MGSMYKAHLHEVPKSFFFGSSCKRAGQQRARSRELFNSARSRKGSRTGTDTRSAGRWQQRAEEIARRYAALLQAYKQVKARTESSHDWRGCCQRMLNEQLRVMQACEFADSLDTTNADPAETLDNVLAGVRQLRGQMLSFLCELDLLQTIEPKPGDRFDRRGCTVVPDSNGARPPEDDLKEAVVSELIERGLAYNDKVVKHALVRVALPANVEQPLQAED